MSLKGLGPETDPGFTGLSNGDGGGFGGPDTAKI